MRIVQQHRQLWLQQRTEGGTLPQRTASESAEERINPWDLRRQVPHLALLGVVGGSLGWVRGGSCGLGVLGLAVHGWLLTGGWSILNTYCGFREASTMYLNVTMQIWISPRSSEFGLKEQIVKLLKGRKWESLTNFAQKKKSLTNLAQSWR